MNSEAVSPSRTPPMICGRFGLSFYLWWILASAAGLLIGTMILVLLVEVGLPVFQGYVGSPLLDDVIDSALAGAIVGGVFGLAQMLVLRRRIGSSTWWVLASILGMIAGGIASWASLILLGIFPGWHEIGLSSFVVSTAAALQSLLLKSTARAVFGATLGAFQWSVLRRSVLRAGWWVLASALAWPLAIVLASWIEIGLDYTPLPSWGWTLVGLLVFTVAGYIGPAIMGIIIGAITGLVLLLTYRRPITRP